MTSFYSDYGQLSKRTMDAYASYGAHPHSTEERRKFYVTYLEDVVPTEVIVIHIPNHLQPYDLGVRREEIQLKYMNKTLMTCVVSIEGNPTYVEAVAGNLSTIHWRNGFCIPDHHQAWGMCLCVREIIFYSSPDGRNWDWTWTFLPIEQVRDVVAFFRHEFERVRLH